MGRFERVSTSVVHTELADAWTTQSGRGIEAARGQGRVKLVAGTIVADRFRLIRQLGVGGMGAVWLAEHRGLGTACAVKFILAEATAEVRVRFEREARAAAQIRSPHVVQVFDSGIFEETPYIAMEYLEGEDLRARLKRVQRLSPVSTALLIRQVARALARAHSSGLVHRDLKPENIFLVREGDTEIAKVLDFGIAKDLTSSALDGGTKTGSLLGTPYYMSPEQARGLKSVDHRADLWSLAVVAFQCMVGSPPFTSDALGDLLIQIVMGPVPTPSTLAPDCPPGFDAWWTRAAQRNPDDRFQSAKELADDLAVVCGAPLDTETGSFDRTPPASPVHARAKDVQNPVFATNLAEGGPEHEDATRKLGSNSQTTAGVVSAANVVIPSAQRRRGKVMAAAIFGVIALTAVGAIVLRARTSAPAAMSPSAEPMVSSAPVALPADSAPTIASPVAVPSDVATVKTPPEASSPPNSLAGEARPTSTPRPAATPTKKPTKNPSGHEWGF